MMPLFHSVGDDIKSIQLQMSALSLFATAVEKLLRVHKLVSVKDLVVES